MPLRILHQLLLALPKAQKLGWTGWPLVHPVFISIRITAPRVIPALPAGRAPSGPAMRPSILRP